MKKCKICRLPVDRWPIQPRNKLARVCSIECAKQSGKRDAEKQSRRQLRDRKEAIKTHPQLVKEAQRAFNRYIRERDKYLPCISCGKPATAIANEWDAGHYRSVGSAPHHRFNESNCHKQCKRCNQYMGGNYAEYRKGIIDRIGQEQVDQLENNNAVRRYTKDELREIKTRYNRRYVEKKRENEHV
jgi:hypothetical protein